MKRMNVILFIIGCLVIFTTGCGKTEYKLNQSVENIVKVEVILMGEIHDPYTKHEVTLIKEISINEVNTFIDDFKNVECFDVFGDPKTLFAGDKGFKVTYTNGDYEIITYYAQGSYKKGKYLSSEGYHYFDEEQFNNLVEKYSY